MRRLVVQRCNLAVLPKVHAPSQTPVPNQPLQGFKIGPELSRHNPSTLFEEGIVIRDMTFEYFCRHAAPAEILAQLVKSSIPPYFIRPPLHCSRSSAK